MSEYEERYRQFHLSNEQRKSLSLFAELPHHLLPDMRRFFVETVIVENGVRRVVKKEEQGAQLV